jgi:ankyrin repeat protein
MNALDVYQSLPRIQRSLSQNESELEKRLEGDRTAVGWSYETFIEADPSDNKKYLDWILKSYILGGIKLYEDLLSRVKPALEDYMYLVQSGQLDSGEAGKPWTNERVIENYCGLGGCTKKKRVLIGLDGLLDKYQDVLASRKESVKESEQIHKDTEVVFSNSEVTVYYPKTEEASCYYGQGTKWCTAATRGKNMFEEYNNKGSLYIIVGKDGEKYQMHVETGSLMDASDEVVDYKNLIAKYPSLENFSPMNQFIQNKKFIQAVENDDLINVKETLKNGADPTVEDNLAITRACHYGNLDIIELLLMDGRADPRVRDNSCIGIASEYGYTKIVEALLKDRRADPSADNNYSIRWASVKNHPDIVKLLLLDGRANPEAQSNYAIKSASENGYIDVIKAFLQDERTSLSAKNLALKVASRNGHADIVELLLQAGVDPTSENNYALRWATKNGHSDVVAALLKDGRVKN